MNLWIELGKRRWKFKAIKEMRGVKINVKIKGRFTLEFS
jgi:hypothetical protein